jgi:hypothetical protein
LCHDEEISIRARYAEKNFLIVPFLLNSPDFGYTGIIVPHSNLLKWAPFGKRSSIYQITLFPSLYSPERGFSPTETVGGSTDSGVPAGRRKSGTLTIDPGEPGADSGLPDFPSGAGAAGLVLRFGTGGWSGISWPLRSSSARELARKSGRTGTYLLAYRSKARWRFLAKMQ